MAQNNDHGSRLTLNMARIAAFVSGDEIFENVMTAMQPAEELSGPVGAQYVALMERIAHEAQRRANNARSQSVPREWTVTFNVGHVGHTHIVLAHSHDGAEAVFRGRILSGEVVSPVNIVIKERS